MRLLDPVRDSAWPKEVSLHPDIPQNSTRVVAHEDAPYEAAPVVTDDIEFVYAQAAHQVHRLSRHHMPIVVIVFFVRTAVAFHVPAGMPISFFRDQHRFGDRPYLTLKIGLEMDRDKLYRRIEERVDRMVDRGLLQEVEGLLEMGYDRGLKPMQSLGYKQMIQFRSNELGWDEAVRQMKRNTRHYAKRQWTWFKTDQEVCWRDESTDRNKIFEEVGLYLTGEGAE